MAPYILHAMPGSLYSGKARAYLRKQHVDFVEHAAGRPRFRAEIVPRIGRWIIPVLETPQGELIQDGADIIAHFEARGLARLPAYAGSPVQRVVSRIFELFGGEGMVRPAMHYRWNFDAENLDFLMQDFSGPLAPGADMQARREIFASSSARMRQAAAIFGVNAATAPAIEQSYETFLALFEAHLETTPYLLGGAPTVGDYGLFAPLFAHLGRDPYPAMRMKQTAWRVWRWVERMNAPGPDAGEYVDDSEDLFANDAVPDTLRALLAFVAQDYLPEIRAFVGFTNRWLGEHPDLQPGAPVGDRPSQRVIGMTSFAWRGQELTVGVFPYRLYLLQQVQDAFDGLDTAQQASARGLLDQVGLADILDLRTTRRVERFDNREVWAAAKGP